LYLWLILFKPRPAEPARAAVALREQLSELLLLETRFFFFPPRLRQSHCYFTGGACRGGVVCKHVYQSSTVRRLAKWRLQQTNIESLPFVNRRTELSRADTGQAAHLRLRSAAGRAADGRICRSRTACRSSMRG